MIFISRYKNYKLGIRPTIRQVAHSSSGSEEVIIHKGVTIEFQNANFDTRKWGLYSRIESPDRINTIKNEDDLIRLMKASPYYEVDFFERGKTESIAERKIKLQREMARLEAEESAQNPEQAPSMSIRQPEVVELAQPKTIRGTRGSRMVEDTGPAPIQTRSKSKFKKAGRPKSSSSKILL